MTAARRWQELRANAWSEARINDIFVGATGRIQDSVGRNHDRYVF